MPDSQKLRWRSDPSGERCLIITLLDQPAPHRLLSQLAQFLLAQRLPAVRDIVPAVQSIGIHYQPEQLWRIDSQLAPYSQLRNRVDALLSRFTVGQQSALREVEIPVCYGGSHGPDLADIASRCGMSAEEAIARHQAVVVDVMMLGFMPGHPYLGGLDRQFSLPRRSSPRLQVPQGSIGVANAQSVIYPMASPGGWNLIGRTPLQLFAAERDAPCLLQAGDRVRFRAIDSDEFRALEGEQYVA